MELKPCPFCGSPATYGSLGGDEQNWYVWCKAECRPDNYGSFEEAAAAWNTRCDQPPIHEIQVEILTRLALDEKTVPDWVLPGDRKTFTETIRGFAMAEGLWLDDDKKEI